MDRWMQCELEQKSIRATYMLVRMEHDTRAKVA
nr:MAG TPA_asm: hypothetical protein [Caudoviricetes sp.]